MRLGLAGAILLLLCSAGFPWPGSRSAKQGSQPTRSVIGHGEDIAFCYSSILVDPTLFVEMRTLGRSLRDVGAVDPLDRQAPQMIAMVADSVPVEMRLTLEMDGWLVRSVPLRPDSYEGSSLDTTRAADERMGTPEFPKVLTTAFSKISFFQLHNEGCGKVAYLEPITFVRLDPTPVFKACRGFCAVLKENEKLDAIVMVVHPSKALYDEVAQALFAWYAKSKQSDFEDFVNDFFLGFRNAPTMFKETKGRAIQAKGLVLERLPGNCNAHVSLHTFAEKWPRESWDQDARVLTFDGLVGTSAVWYASWLMPDLTKWGWEETRMRLPPAVSERRSNGNAFCLLILVPSAAAVVVLDQWYRVTAKAWPKFPAQGLKVLRCGQLMGSGPPTIWVLSGLMAFFWIETNTPAATGLRLWLLSFVALYVLGIELLHVLVCRQGGNDRQTRLQWKGRVTAVGLLAGVWAVYYPYKLMHSLPPHCLVPNLACILVGLILVLIVSALPPSGIIISPMKWWENTREVRVGGRTVKRKAEREGLLGTGRKRQ